MKQEQWSHRYKGSYFGADDENSDLSLLSLRKLARIQVIYIRVAVCEGGVSGGSNGFVGDVVLGVVGIQ